MLITVNKYAALKQQKKAGDRRRLTILTAPKSTESEEEEGTNLKRKVSGSPGRDQSRQCQGPDLPGSPGAGRVLPRAPQLGRAGGEEQGWKGDGQRATKREDTGSREEQPFKDAPLNSAFFAKEQ